MTRILIVGGLLAGLLAELLSPNTTWASPVTFQQASNAALRVISARYPARLAANTPEQALLTQVVPLEHQGATVGYEARMAAGGYILLRADDQAPPVKLSGDKGTIEGLPPAFLAVIKLELAEELSAIARSSPSPAFAAQWRALTAPSLISRQSITPAFASGNGPLLTSAWNQGEPFNLYCPAAPLGPGGRAWAGCGTVALAQILYYYQMPAQVARNLSYTDTQGDCQGQRSMSEAGLAPYNWAAMTDQPNALTNTLAQQAAAQLCYHCAVALKADFEGSVTLSYPDIGDEISGAFHYTSSPLEYKSLYTDAQWYDKIAASIDAQKPVLYDMWAANYSAGHTAVCDGYRNGNEIHINLGWGGNGNAWYNIDTVDYVITWTHHFATFDIAPATNNAAAPQFTQQPQGGTYAVGEPVTLTAKVQGYPRPNLQWYKDGQPLPGQTGSSLQFAPITPQDAGAYTVAINTGGQTLTSAPAVVAVMGPPQIVQDLAPSYALSVGDSLTLTFLANSSEPTPLTYTWMLNGLPLANLTTTNLCLSNVTTNATGQYQCIATGSWGGTTSTLAQITVLSQPPVLAWPGGAVKALTGSQIVLGGAYGGREPVQFQWWFNSQILGGATGNTLALNGGKELNGQYWAVAANPDGQSQSPAYQITYLDPAQITADPKSITLGAGQSLALTASATGDELQLQWWKDGYPLAGETGSILTRGPVQTRDSGMYWLTATNWGSSATSGVATVTVAGAPTITSSPPDLLVAAGNGFSLVCAAESQLPITWRWYLNDLPITNATNSSLSFNAVTIEDEGEYIAVAGNFAGTATSQVASVTVLITPAILLQPMSQKQPVGTDITLEVSATNNLPLLYQWWKDGAPLIGQTEATLTLRNLSSANNGQYQAAISNALGAFAWSSNASVSVTHPPVIQTQSQNQQLAQGGNATLQVITVLDTVQGRDYPPESYQWFKAGIAIGGETTNTLYIGNAQTGDSGAYTLQISSADGVLISPPIQVMVLVPPQFTRQPQSQGAAAGAAITLSAGASGSQPLEWQWFRDGQPLVGATNAVATLLAQAGSYQCTVSNAVGAAQSQTITIEVKPSQALKATAAIRNGVVWMSFATEPGKTYQIYASTNLTEWTLVDEVQAADVILEYPQTQPGQARFLTCREKQL